MERAEFRRIVAYIEDVEGSLEQGGAQEVASPYHLTKLHLAIERLMRASTETKDRQLQTSLATLEHRARQCMQCIEVGLTAKC